MKTKRVKFKDLPPGGFILGAYAPDRKSLLNTYSLHSMNGRIMRAVGQALRSPKAQERVSEALYIAGHSIVKDIGGYTQVVPIYDNLVIADRLQILIQSKIDENPIIQPVAKCPLPVSRDGVLVECGTENIIPNYDYRELDVVVPESAAEILWWRDTYPCFEFSAPELGCSHAVIRYNTTAMERASFMEGRVESGNAPYYILAQSIMEWDGKSLSEEQVRSLRRYHYFKDEEEIVEFSKPLLRRLMEAYKESHLGADLEVNVKCAGCQGRFPFEPETISHFL